MKLDLSKYVPVEVNSEKVMKWIRRGLIACAAFSSTFLLRYLGAYNSLHMRLPNGHRILQNDVHIQSFSYLIGGMTFSLFPLYFLALIALAISNYMDHYKDSKSIYLMRRLPDPMELHRRCLALPVLGILMGLVTVILLLGIYYGIYVLCTPAGCLP